jgi:hypothetical protein
MVADGQREYDLAIRSSSNSVFVGSVVSKQVSPIRCLVCGCVLNGDNCSEWVNVCKFCQHSLES